ncbi:MAG: hypothetical protein NTY11_03330 [Candidatus Parcubacteria bacterium]|nr:hypothetical protein [Candidatus Parcubacteria bacterium]
MTRTKYGRVSPNPLTGRKGSKVGKRKLTFGQRIFIAVLGIAIIGITVGLGFGAKGGQCCTPTAPTPEPIIKEVEKKVFVPVPIFAELPCANHQLEIGFEMFGPDPLALAITFGGRLEFGKIELGRLGVFWFDIAGGLSGATIENQTTFGIDIKLGIAFRNPGPYFDALEYICFPRWTDSYYEGIGLRLPIPVLQTPNSRVSALLYPGYEGFIHYSQSLEYTESNAFLFGGAVRICNHDFSLGFQAELKAVHQVRDCNDQGWNLGFGVKLSLWF